MPLYNRGKLILVNGTVDWGGATNVDILLVDDTYVFNADDNFVSDVSADELSTTNYARDDMTSRTVTEDDTGDRVVFDAADNTWSALGPGTGGPTIGGAVIFDNTAGSDAARELIAFIDLANTTVNGGDFTIQWNASDGVFYLEDAP